MKFKYENIIIIIGLLLMICIGYIFGMNTICCNSDYEDSEIHEEYAELGKDDEEFRNSFSNSNSENENVEQDLTTEEENVIVNEDVEEIENIEDIEDEEIVLTDEEIIISETEITIIDEMKLVDSYEDGNWYCYYLYCDGDVYVVTLKNGHVDMAVQLN